MSSIHYLWDAIKKYCNSFPEPRIIEQNYLCDVVSYLYSFPMKRRSGSCFECPWVTNASGLAVSGLERGSLILIRSLHSQ